MDGSEYVLFVCSCCVWQDKRTALIWAVEKGHKEVAISLIQAGADLNIQDQVRHLWTVYGSYVYAYIVVQEISL